MTVRDIGNATVKFRRPLTHRAKGPSWLALALIASGAMVFLSSFYPNIATGNAFVGDLLELVGTAALVSGASAYIRRISTSPYVTALILGGCFMLTFARFLDFTDEVRMFDGLAVLSGDGAGHTLAMRLSESLGYIGILLTMLALMHELSTMFDASEREKRRYRELHHASQYLARVADMTADAVLAVNDEGKVEVWNKGAERLFGHAKGEAAHLNVRDVLTVDTGGAGYIAWAGSPARAGDVTATRKDGAQFAADATFSVITGEDGTAIGVSVVVRDIDERKHAERKLIESRKLLVGALHNADVGLFVLDRDGEIIEFNTRMQELTGLTRAMLHDETVYSVAAKLLDDPQSLATAIYERVLKQGKHIELRNVKLHRADGSVRVCNGSMSPVTDEAGNVIAGAAVVVDVTDREALQARLLEAQKMDSIGRLAGGIAHDFNNILTGVLGYATLAKKSVEAGSPVLKHLTHIEASAVRASELTQQLLTFSRGGARNESKLALAPVIDETVKLVSHSLNPNVRIAYTPCEGLDQVSADPTQMHQMIVNLCLNARDAIAFAGEIHVSAENVEVTADDRDRLSIAVPGRYVRIRVQDTGRGMTPEVCQRIFEPFFSTKKQGQAYGLGLSVVYGIVHSHRGAITVESEVGTGSTFDVYLPSAGQAPAPAPSVGNGKTAKPAKETVLVVDDEQLLRAVLQDILEMSGYDVLQASTGEEAIAVYQERKDDIAVVILDVVMPGMGGEQALDELVKINPGLRCIISSGFGGEGMGGRHQRQYLRFVPKPFSMANVTAAVHDLLHA
ncbi:MAG: PAS domain S-box protein [Candidatus Hydrogenedentes bacterium]|nr:PAS domain S-box protein [Candidatus Hydrogenedentota bacterium]